MIILIVWFVYSRLKPIQGLKTLKAEDFRHQIENGKPILIDVRETGEFRSGYIRGAINLPLSQLSQRLGEVPKDKPIFLYCQSGMRSKSAAKILQKNGYADLAHLQGGISAWQGKLAR